MKKIVPFVQETILTPKLSILKYGSRRNRARIVRETPFLSEVSRNLLFEHCAITFCFCKNILYNFYIILVKT